MADVLPKLWRVGRVRDVVRLRTSDIVEFKLLSRSTVMESSLNHKRRVVVHENRVLDRGHWAVTMATTGHLGPYIHD